MQIFADSDFFIGLYLITDPHHKNCLLIAKKVKEELITSYDVVDETVTKLSYIQSKNIALEFANDLERNKILITYSTPTLFRLALQIFRSQSSKHVSLTDCLNMAIMKEKKIERVLSFDKIYEKNGFSLMK